MSPDVVLRIPEDVIFEMLDGEAVLLNLATGTYFSLSGSGARIWQLIDEHGSIEGVRESMLREYDVEQEALDVDIDQLVSDLILRRLLVRTEGAVESR